MDKSVTENHVNENESMTFVQLAMALADDYESVYVIDTDDDSYVEYAAVGEFKELTRRSEGDDFYADTVRNCKLIVYPDDRQKFLESFRKENVMAALDGGRSFTLNYRLIKDGVPAYYFLKTIRGKGRDGKHIIIGVQNVDAQVRREKAIVEENRRYSEIAGSLASLFEVIYLIDLNTGRYKEYSASSKFAELGIKSEGDDFFRVVKEQTVGVIHEDDYARVTEALQRSNMVKVLERCGSFSLSYRQILDGRPQYVSLLAIRQRNTSDRVVIGIRNVDEQVQRENAAAQESATYSHIAKALASRYEVIYYINIENNEYVQYSASERFAKLGMTVSGKDFFKSVKADISKHIHPDDKKRLFDNLRKDNLVEVLAQSGSMSMTYRQTLGGRTQYVTVLAVRPKNDDKHVIMGALNVDARVRREQSMARENEAVGEIVKTMAQMYEVIYYVNIVTDEYREYCHSEKYSKLKTGAAGTDFFVETQHNMHSLICTEDYQMMAEAMKKENLLKSLAETGSLTLNYRMMLDGKPTYVTLFALKPKEDSEHIIIAVANVDSAKRREMAYKQALGSAMDMANRDALTGVKNKHAYVQSEMEIDRLIAEDKCYDFAVLVADVNGLKQVNDTLGHHAGDEYIKAACKVICTTFKHSPVFRIGGDEFAVIMKGSDFEDREMLIEQLYEKMKANGSAGLVTAAAGKSEYIKGKDLRMQDVFERADNAMYEQKKLCRERRRE